MKNKALIASILLGSTIIAGSLVFVGYNMNNKIEPLSIEKGIENYIARQQRLQEEAQQRQRELELSRMKEVPPVKPGEYLRGNPDAPITLIEYSDFECPYCKSFHETAAALLTKYPDKVNWVYRHLPLSFHDPLATQQALAVECAASLGGKEAFWRLSDLIFETTKSNKGMTTTQLYALVEQIDLDAKEIQGCVESEQFIEKVKADIAEAQSLGIHGTPGNILLRQETKDIRALPGAVPFNTLEAAMLSLLQEN